MNEFKPPDMNSFEKIFKKSFPGMQSLDWKNWQDVNSIESFVQKALEGSFKQYGINTQGGASSRSMYEVFETHDRVIVKINIPVDYIDDKRLFVKGNKLKLEQTNSHNTEEIPLPASVNNTTARASYKNGVLQVSMRKLSTDDRYKEVNIRYS